MEDYKRLAKEVRVLSGRDLNMLVLVVGGGGVARQNNVFFYIDIRCCMISKSVYPPFLSHSFRNVLLLFVARRTPRFHNLPIIIAVLEFFIAFLFCMRNLCLFSNSSSVLTDSPRLLRECKYTTGRWRNSSHDLYA